MVSMEAPNMSRRRIPVARVPVTVETVHPFITGTLPITGA